MRLLAFLTLTCITLSFASRAEERIQHYEAVKPANVHEALALLAERTKKAEEGMKKNQLEAVHEQSYTLEAAGDFLQAHLQKEQQALDGVNEAIQEIHALSEKGDSAGVHRAMPRLKKHLEALQRLMAQDK